MRTIWDIKYVERSQRRARQGRRSKYEENADLKRNVIQVLEYTALDHSWLEKFLRVLDLSSQRRSTSVLVETEQSRLRK
jgi:hypothetical protein